MKEQCWEHTRCGREPGGDKVEELGVCPAAENEELDGINDGRNGGRICWALAGTFCRGDVQGSFAQKALACVDCEFFAQVRAEQGRDFKFLTPGQEYEQTIGVIDRLREVTVRQERTIAELSTPVLEIWQDVLVLPVIGVVDTMRVAEIMERLLESVKQTGCRYVILDITGVRVVDTSTANQFLKIVRAGELLGASFFISGIRPEVAQTLVEIGADLSALRTLGNIKAALQECLNLRRSRLKVR